MKTAETAEITTSPRTVAYMGVPATVFDVRKAGPLGERVVVTEWHAKAVGQPVEHEAGAIVASHVKGDGRKPSFQRFEERAFDTRDQAVAWALEALR